MRDPAADEAGRGRRVNSIDPNEAFRRQVIIAGQVRQNAFPAGIAAALMLWFGMNSWGGGAVGSPLFLTAAEICEWVVLFGGALMAVSTIWSITGRRPALAYDAGASILIGVGFFVVALLMVVAGAFGYPQILYFLFGAVFLSSGLRNGREYFSLRAPDSAAAPATNVIHESVSPPIPRAGADDIMKERGARRRSNFTAPVDSPLVASPKECSETEPSISPIPSPPEGGFLASFAKKDPPKPN